MNIGSGRPLGTLVPQSRNSEAADIIHAVEQTDSGDTFITVGRVYFHSVTGEPKQQVSERAMVRLTPAEREELIRLLMAHRFAEMTADLGGEASGQ